MTAPVVPGTEAAAEPWRDPSRPVAERVADLLGRMTLAEKLAQLGSVWVGAAGDGADGFAPMQHEFSADRATRARYQNAFAAIGCGQLSFAGRALDWTSAQQIFHFNIAEAGDTGFAVQDCFQARHHFHRDA